MEEAAESMQVESGTSSTRNSVKLDAVVSDLCHKCNEKPGTYTLEPCGCYRMCRHCAMKMATGGKCSNCKQFFTSVVPIDPVENAEAAEEEAEQQANEIDVICIKAENCQRCGQSPALFASVPCGCFRVCRKCAMKMATGGKCSSCKAYFTSFASIAEGK